MLPESLLEKLAGLPQGPGCYIFRDAAGQALYVGKAKNLRARVRSYFQDGSHDTRAFIPLLIGQVADLETVVVSSEKEAAILENNFIKESRPKYNIKLRDDKEYLSLRLSKDHPFPRLELVRRPKPDGARYFGPFHSAQSARKTLHLVEKHFQLRTCGDRELKSRSRPCLQYQIKRCPAPCVLPVSAELYAQQVRAVELFLDGRHDELTVELEAQMQKAAQGFQYELAALYRDQREAVRSVKEQQRVVSVSQRDQDVVGIFREAEQIELQVLNVRAGRLVDTASFSNRRTELPDDEVVAAFLRDYYAEAGPGAQHIPDEVVVPVLPEAHAGIADWLSELRLQALGGKARVVALLCPARGPRKQLLALAMANAKHAFAEKQRAKQDVEERLVRLQERLRLPALPRRIECCDISHLGGKDTVGAVVALADGAPDRSRYRTYHVKGIEPGDDYAAMYQVLYRRFRRGQAAEAEDAAPSERWGLPDLFVVDGGRGQLAVAQAAAQDLGLHALSLVGLAKERETVTSEKLVDRVYLPGQLNPLPLRAHSSELFLLALARDEAHRFANRGRSKLGDRRRMTSKLDAIKGVGPKTRRALLEAFGSVEGIRQATDDALVAAGARRDQLAALRAALGN